MPMSGHGPFSFCMMMGRLPPKNGIRFTLWNDSPSVCAIFPYKRDHLMIRTYRLTVDGIREAGDNPTRFARLGLRRRL